MIPKKITNLIAKVILENQQPEKSSPINEIGKFFVVEKPYKNCKKEDILFERTCFDTIDENKTIGVFKHRSDASRVAVEEIKKYNDTLKELEEKMNSYRTAKQELGNKRKETKDLLKTLK